MNFAAQGNGTETAEHIWKMLDELAMSDPKAYSSFISKTLQEGKTSMERELKPKRWRLVQVKIESTSRYLLCNFIKDPSTVVKEADTDVPIQTSWEILNEGDFSILNIHIHPTVVSALEKESQAFSELLNYICFQLRQFSKVTADAESAVSCDFSSLSLKVREKLDRFVSTKIPNDTLSPQRNQQPEIQLPFQVNSGLNGSESFAEKTFTLTNLKPSKILISEVGQSDLPEPIYEVSENDSLIVYSIRLPDVESLPRYDLTLTKNGIDFEVPKLCHLIHAHGKKIDEAGASAKFFKKTKVLKVKLPIEKESQT